MAFVFPEQQYTPREISNAVQVATFVASGSGTYLGRNSGGQLSDQDGPGAQPPEWQGNPYRGSAIGGVILHINARALPGDSSDDIKLARVIPTIQQIVAGIQTATGGDRGLPPIVLRHNNGSPGVFVRDEHDITAPLVATLQGELTSEQRLPINYFSRRDRPPVAESTPEPLGQAPFSGNPYANPVLENAYSQNTDGSRTSGKDANRLRDEVALVLRLAATMRTLTGAASAARGTEAAILDARDAAHREGLRDRENRQALDAERASALSGVTATGPAIAGADEGPADQRATRGRLAAATAALKDGNVAAAAAAIFRSGQSPSR